MSEIKNVVIAGAGGKLGPSVLPELLNSSFAISVLSREDSTATFPPSVKVLRTDYTPESLKSALKGQDAVISLLGGSALGDLQFVLIDAAIAAGVKRFVPSEFGSDTGNPKVIESAPLFEGKAKVIEYLKSKEKEGLSWTGVAAGAIFDWGLQVGFLGANLKDHSFALWDSGTSHWATSNLSRIGQAVVRLLEPEHYSSTANRFIYISSHTVSQKELLAVLEKVTGKEWSVTPVESKAAVQEGSEKLKAGDFTGVFALLQNVIFVHEDWADWTKVDPGWNEKLGLPAEDLESDIRKAVEVASKA